YSLLYSSAPHPHLHSFPTRRSSDLDPVEIVAGEPLRWHVPAGTRASDMTVVDPAGVTLPATLQQPAANNQRPATSGQPPATSEGDRKSTRLNSSHVEISYAVFCLKK